MGIPSPPKKQGSDRVALPKGGVSLDTSQLGESQDALET